MDLHSVALAEPGAGWQRFGTHGGGVGEFTGPSAAAFRALGQLVVLDSGNRRLVFMDDLSGSGWTTYGHPGLVPSEGGFVDPRGLAVDAVRPDLGERPGRQPGDTHGLRLTAMAGSRSRCLRPPTKPLPYGIGRTR